MAILVATLPLNGAGEGRIVAFMKGFPYKFSPYRPCQPPPPPGDISKAEAKTNRGIDRAAIEETVRQAAIVLREHDSGIGIEFLRKLPIGDKGNGVERPVAVCERRGISAVDDCTKGGLVVMIISADQIQI